MDRRVTPPTLVPPRPTHLSRPGTQDNNFLFLFLNFDTVLWNSTPKHFAKNWRIERDGIRAIKFEAARIHFKSDAFVVGNWSGHSLSPGSVGCKKRLKNFVKRDDINHIHQLNPIHFSKILWMMSTQRVNRTDWFFLAFILNARLAIRQRADLFEANISANKISLTEGQSYTAFACSHLWPNRGKMRPSPTKVRYV